MHNTNLIRITRDTPVLSAEAESKKGMKEGRAIKAGEYRAEMEGRWKDSA